ncbi:hypothetical protein GCM10011517_02680 [Actibacterium pelagium]|uniref:Uncharacterized protein n=1 Tax=Actibacterium pelagium TaxID=2029103 RepID=A0A917AAK7_9RHOB|nr:hypothetical protein GCM10011517_02680 [Actibacterium pelagium]
MSVIDVPQRIPEFCRKAAAIEESRQAIGTDKIAVGEVAPTGLFYRLWSVNDRKAASYAQG